MSILTRIRKLEEAATKQRLRNEMQGGVGEPMNDIDALLGAIGPVATKSFLMAIVREGHALPIRVRNKS